jgi:hypothetical protein
MNPGYYTDPYGEEKILWRRKLGELKTAVEKPQRPFH